MELFLFTLAAGILFKLFRALFRLQKFSETGIKRGRPGTEKLPPLDSPARWFGVEEGPTFQGFSINGLVYYGGKLPDYTGNNDSCLINPHLELSEKEAAQIISKKTLSYAAISPQQRSSYLNWHSEGREDPECDTGFVLLYFYGLERRLFIDGARRRVTPEERKTIVLEVLRLLQIYGESSFLRHYFIKFLAMEWAMFNDRAEIPHFLKISGIVGKGIFPAIAARLADRGLPLSGETALDWLIHSQEGNNLTAARRHPELFRQLFLHRYSEKFKKGIPLNPGRTPLILEYRGANPSLGGRLKIRVSNLQNPFVVRAPLQKISALGVACAGELESYSLKFLELKGKETSSIKALLPLDLVSFLPEGDDIRLQLSNLCATGPVLVRRRLLERILCNLPFPEGQEDYCSLRKKTALLGFHLVPGKGAAALALCEDSFIGLYEGTVILEPSEEYLLLAALLRLGAFVAQALGNASPAKEQVFSSLIRGNEKLSEEEREPLQAFLLWTFRTPQSARQIRAVLKDFSEEGKAAMARVLLTVVMADGAIGKEEVIQLEKLFTYIGLEKKRLPSDIAFLASAVQVPGGEAEGEKALLPIEREIIILRQEEFGQIQKILSGAGLHDENLPSPEEAP